MTRARDRAETLEITFSFFSAALPDQLSPFCREKRRKWNDQNSSFNALFLHELFTLIEIKYNNSDYDKNGSGAGRKKKEEIVLFRG